MADVKISQELFDRLRTSDEFQQILKDLDIADEDHLDLFDTLDVDGNGVVDVDELLQGLSKLRGDARRSDIVTVNLVMRHIQAELRVFYRSTMRVLKGQERELAVLRQNAMVAGKGGSPPPSPRLAAAAVAKCSGQLAADAILPPVLSPLTSPRASAQWLNEMEEEALAPVMDAPDSAGL